VEVVRADSAYFSKIVISYIRVVLKAAPRIDYNLRRKGKKSLATFEFIAWWRSEKGKRGYIERYFALLKRLLWTNRVSGNGLRNSDAPCFAYQYQGFGRRLGSS
jgi:hypothetical protein